MRIAAATATKLLQSCLTLCDTIDGSPSGSTIPGILQARILEWGAIAFSVVRVNVRLFQERETETELIASNCAYFSILLKLVFKQR